MNQVKNSLMAGEKRLIYPFSFSFKQYLFISFLFICVGSLVSCQKILENIQYAEKDSILKNNLSLRYYYVDNTGGSDNNDGKTLQTSWKTIQKSCNSATPGSFVVIRGGTYHEQVRVNVSGLKDKPITFMNYKNDVVNIDGARQPGSTILSIIDKSFLVFKGITIQNLTKNDAQGILVTATPNGKVTGITFSHLIIKKINWTSSASKIPSSFNNAQALIVYGQGSTQANAVSNLTIDNCEISNNILGYSEAVSLDGNIDGFSITNNKVHDNTNIGIAAIGNYGTSTNSGLDQTRNGVISRNICFKNSSKYATSGGIYADGARDLTIERNESYENGYGIEVGNEQNGSARNIIVASNVLYLNQNSGLALGGYDNTTTGQVLNSSFYNNSFYHNNSNFDGSGEFIVTKASGCIIENNVFYTNSQNVLFSLTPIAPQKNNTINYNCWFTPEGNPDNIQVNFLNSTYTTFNEYKSGTRQDDKSFFKNPFYKSPLSPYPDLHLLTTSPCINSGNIGIIKNANGLDYDGNLLIKNGHTSLGAYQIK